MSIMVSGPGPGAMLCGDVESTLCIIRNSRNAVRFCGYQPIREQTDY